MSSQPVQRLEPHELSRYEARLRALFERLQPDTRSLEERTRSPSGGQELGELSNAAMHLADQGSEEFRHEIDATLLENEEFLLSEVLAALDRVALGNYGLCEECGERIAAERLAALPYVRYCVRCADELGSGRAVNLNEGRPTAGESLSIRRAEEPADRIPRADAGRAPAASDTHAAETPGGGSASGGLAGSNQGHGEPDFDRLIQEGGGAESTDVDATEDEVPQAGRSGGAVGGTPAGKRSRFQ